jgi:hypothetical protein
MPVRVSEHGVGVVYEKVNATMPEWADKLNQAFQTFYENFHTGNFDVKLYQAFVAMSIAPSRGPTPLSKIFDGEHTCYGSVRTNASTPWWQIKRSVTSTDVNKEMNETNLVNIRECWVGIPAKAYAQSMYWGVATWCSKTASALSTDPTVLNRSEKMSNNLNKLSLDIASILSTPSMRGHTFKDLTGALGPRVRTTEGGIVRIAVFTCEFIDRIFLILIEEAIIEELFDYAKFDINACTDDRAPSLTVHGRIVLSNCFALQNPDDPEGAPRVWELPKDRANFLSQLEATEQLRSFDGEPGTRILLSTRHGSLDAFVGLNVSLVQLSEHLGKQSYMLDTD